MGRSREYDALWSTKRCGVTLPVQIFCDPYWPVQTIPTCPGMLLKTLGIIGDHSPSTLALPERLLCSRGLTRASGHREEAASGHREDAPTVGTGAKPEFGESEIEEKTQISVAGTQFSVRNDRIRQSR